MLGKVFIYGGLLFNWGKGEGGVRERVCEGGIGRRGESGFRWGCIVNKLVNEKED